MTDPNSLLMFLREKDCLSEISLSYNHIHIWSTTLNYSPAAITCLKQVLSVDECIRAEKYYFDKDRDQFIVGRGLLRHILGHYLQTFPSKIEFVYNKYGKPSLSNLHSNYNLHFNLSHSNGIILYAISRNSPIGIDLEYHHSDFPIDDVASGYLSPNELEVLHSSSSYSKISLFYQLWTRKEAYAKGLGKGLSIPFNKFDVPQNSKTPVVRLTNDPLVPIAIPWYVKDIIVRSEYSAAIATVRKDLNISYPFYFKY